MKLLQVIIPLMLVSNAFAGSKVGVLLPLTGPASDAGRWIQQGLELAAGAYPDIELVFEDDQCGGRSAIAAYRKLIDKSNVSLILGPACGTAFVPLAPIAEREGVVLVALGLCSKRVREAGNHSLSILPSIAKSSEALVEFARTGLSTPSISILSGQDELGEDARVSAEQTADRLKIRVVSTNTFDRSTQDFSVHLNRYKHEDSGALLVFAFPSDYLNILRQAGTLRIAKPLLFLPTFQSEAALELTRRQGLSIYYSYPLSSSQEEVTFNEMYQKRFGNAPDSFFPGAGYDALRFVAAAVRRCAGEDGRCLLETLSTTRLDSGVNGPILLDHDGNNAVSAPFEIRTVSHGKPRRWTGG